MLQRFWTFFLVFAFSSLAFTMSSDPALTIEDLEKTIRSMTQDKSCTTNADCMTVGIGHKACGGPEEFLVYSRKQTDIANVSRYVAAYNKQKKRQVREQGLISTCVVTPRPDVTCDNQVCRAKAPVTFNPFKTEDK